MKRGFLNTTQAKKEPLYQQAEPATGGFMAELAKTTSTNLSYGKVEDAGVPEGYKPQLSYREVDPNTMVHSEDGIIFTTIPATFNDPDGYSQWIVRGNTKRKVIECPGYPRPIPKPKGRKPAYIIKSTPTMGIGMFAARDIQFGELVMSERPLLVNPRSINLPIRVPDGCTDEQYRQLMMFEWEKQLEVAVGRMEDEDKTAFLDLMNNHKEDGSGPLLGITRTNGYGVAKLFDGPDAATPHLYTAVGKHASRVNHSCMPNVTQNFTIPSFSLQFTATKLIKAGEQIFYTYCGKFQSVAERQAELAPYGIVCQCPACANATPQTDALRKNYRQKIEEFKLLSMQFITDPSRAAEVLDSVLKLKNALDKEGLNVDRCYATIFVILRVLSIALEDHDAAERYMQQIKAWANFDRGD
ncbi:hypothetical protein B0H34DRAFT_758532 [Crassisporium funariophilum]|nr:hypothetical protein B0H34DRAFT_758532 [Crassisporium funariophilum]